MYFYFAYANFCEKHNLFVMQRRLWFVIIAFPENCVWCTPDHFKYMACKQTAKEMVSEYDQEIPQSQTADKPVVS